MNTEQPKAMEGETPRVNAEFDRFNPENPKPYFHDMAALARQLERELSEATAEIERLNEVLGMGAELHSEVSSKLTAANQRIESLEKDARIAALEYAACLCDSKNLSFKNEAYRTALEDVKTSMLAAVERLKAGEPMEATCIVSAAIAQTKTP